MRWRTLDDADLAGKRVLVRVDYNVPMADGRVADATRIAASARTVREIIDRGGTPILLSHLGRPGGRRQPELSFGQIAQTVEERLGVPVEFCPETVGATAEARSRSIPRGGALLMENVRFHKEETENEREFSERVARLGDVYCNDAFSASHRAHASTEGLAKLLPAYAGRLLEAEINALERALERPKPPVAALVGGAKVSTKLAVLRNLVRKVDCLIVGGGMANTFYLAGGLEIGASLAEPDMAGTARSIEEAATKSGCRIVLPDEVVVSKEARAGAAARAALPGSSAPDEMVLDCGPNSAGRIGEMLKEFGTLLWNGPMGAFEIPPFDEGTNAVAQRAAQLTRDGGLITVAGGGDTVAALNNAGVADQFTHVSTAGGAFLEWLEGRQLPGIAALSS